MAADMAADVQCSNPQCRIAETGKCVEGLELAKCPHYGKPASPAEQSPGTQPVALEHGVSLPLAERLTAELASSVMRENQSRVIAIVGPVNAGKTSLIAAVYDLFQEGPVGSLQFWRSRTLFAFEQACHHSRIESQRNTPLQARTAVGAYGFYHLGIHDDNDKSSVDLLISDRSGEEYKSIADNASTAMGFPEILRADVISILVDGERLLDLEGRHNARSSVQMIIQGLIDSGAISQQALSIILTKLDDIQQAKEGERALRDFEVFVEHIRKVHGTYFSDVSSFRVAASPTTAILRRGYGMPELLRYWLSQRAALATAKPWSGISSRAISRITQLAN